MVKKITILAVVVVVALLGFGLNTKNYDKTNTESEPEPTISLPDVKAPNLELSLPSPDNLLKEKAWNVFKNYLENAYEHDLPGLRVLSHQISSTCNNPELNDACFSLMDNVYFIGSSFVKDDFKNIWSDEKQIILATDYRQISIEALGINESIRSVIYFTIDKNGNPKILSFNDMENKNLDPVIEDTDGDGWWEGIEVFFYSR